MTFTCDKCSYETKEESNIKRHIKTVHDKIKECKCDKCDYVCSRNNTLKIHINTVHDKIRDFKCNKCGHEEKIELEGIQNFFV